MSDKELPYALMRWIKAQREDEERHRRYMVAKNYQEDKEFMRYVSFVVHQWHRLRISEKRMILSLTERHESVRCLTPGQRSAVANLFYKYCA